MNWDSCEKEHEDLICFQESCDRKSCILQHPKHCKYFEVNGFCKHGEKCAYSHRITRCKTDIESAIQEINSLKKEVENLKVDMASIIKINNEEKAVEMSIERLKRNGCE